MTARLICSGEGGSLFLNYSYVTSVASPNPGLGPVEFFLFPGN